MIVIDAVVRKLPGVSARRPGLSTSRSQAVFGVPQHTRPLCFCGMEVPCSGVRNHAAIAAWRREQSLARTARLRPDLLDEFERAGSPHLR